MGKIKNIIAISASLIVFLLILNTVLESPPAPPPPPPPEGLGSGINYCKFQYYETPNSSEEVALNLLSQSKHFHSDLILDTYEIVCSDKEDESGNNPRGALVGAGRAEPAVQDTFNNYVMTKLECEKGWKTETNGTIIDHMIINPSDPSNTQDAIKAFPGCANPNSPCSIRINLDKIEGCNKRYCEFNSSPSDAFSVSPIPSDIKLLKYWEVGENSSNESCLFGPGCSEDNKIDALSQFTTIQCNDGYKYGKCSSSSDQPSAEAEESCSIHDNNENECSAVPDCNFDIVEDYKNTSILECEGDLDNWINNHLIISKCTNDCYIKTLPQESINDTHCLELNAKCEPTDPSQSSVSCEINVDGNSCSPSDGCIFTSAEEACLENKHCEFISLGSDETKCEFKYIYAGEEPIPDWKRESEGVHISTGLTTSHFPPGKECDDDSIGSYYYNIEGDNISRGECIGEGDCTTLENTDCNDNDRYPNCSWRDYHNQEVCEGGGKAFNIKNDCKPITCENWYNNIYRNTNNNPCGSGKKLNPENPDISKQNEADRIGMCCIDTKCSDVEDHCRGVFKKKESVQDENYEDIKTDMTRICCDINTCREYLDHESGGSCPSGLKAKTQDGGNYVLNHKCLGTIHITGYGSDKDTLLQDLNRNDPTITLDNIEQEATDDGNIYILTNAPDKPLLIKRNDVINALDTSLICEPTGDNSCVVTEKTKNEWARDDLCDYYHGGTSTSPSDSCCEHQTCKEASDTGDFTCGGGEILINNNIPLNQEGVPYHPPTEDFCCSNNQQLLGLTDILKCYRDDEIPIDILNKYITFGGGGGSLPPYVNFTIGRSGNMVEINDIDGKDYVLSDSDITDSGQTEYYNLNQSTCTNLGTPTAPEHIKISCNEDKSINESIVNGWGADSITKYIDDYSLRSELEEQQTSDSSITEEGFLRGWMNGSGKWRYHIHGCLDDDNLLCRIPKHVDGDITGRYGINITTTRANDYTGLYPLGSLKDDMNTTSNYGIRCLNTVGELEGYNTLSEFYVAGGTPTNKRLHKERDMANKNVYPYCPEHRGDYMFAGCNSQGVDERSGDVSVNYRIDAPVFHTPPSDDISYIPILTSDNPVARSSALGDNNRNDTVNECNNLINKRKNDNNSHVRCHGPDDAVFLKPIEYCNTLEEGGCNEQVLREQGQAFYNYEQMYTSSYSGVQSPPRDIIDDLCEDNYYPVGLKVQDIKRSGSTRTAPSSSGSDPIYVQRDICVPKNDEHGNTYYPDEGGTDAVTARDKDFFYNSDQDQAKSFTEIYTEGIDRWAFCAPQELAIGIGDMSGLCVPNESLSTECGDKSNKENCEETSNCEWWPEYSCKKAGSFQKPSDYKELETQIKNNFVGHNNNNGWPESYIPQANLSANDKSAGVQCEGNNECYLKIPMSNTNTLLSTPCTTDDQKSCVKEGDNREYELIGTDPHRGIKIPLSELYRGKVPDWGAFTGSPGNTDGLPTDADMILNSFPSKKFSSEDLNLSDDLYIDIKGASKVLVLENSGNQLEDKKLNPTLITCKEYFENHEQYSSWIPDNKYLPLSPPSHDNLDLYCKKEEESGSISIKGSFYYGDISNDNFIDITSPPDTQESLTIAKNEQWCSPTAPYLMKIATDADADKSFYVCTSCQSPSGTAGSADLSNYGWAEDDGNCVKRPNQCECWTGGENPTKLEKTHAADARHCKWKIRTQMGDHPRQAYLSLEGCKSCPDAPDEPYYLTYANDIEIQRGGLPSRDQGYYPGTYTHASPVKFQEANNYGLFLRPWAAPGQQSSMTEIVAQLDKITPDEWYNETICKLKHSGSQSFGSVHKGFLDQRGPAPPGAITSSYFCEGLDDQSVPTHSECTDRWYGRLTGDLENVGDTLYVDDEHMRPLFYDSYHPVSKCSADSVYPDSSDPGYGVADSRAFRNSCQTYADDVIDTGRGWSLAENLCCDDNKCQMWNKTIESMKATGYKEDLYAYRGRCLKADLQTCEEDEECYGGGCCDTGECSSSDCDEVEDAAVTAQTMDKLMTGDVGGAIWCFSAPQWMGGC